MQEPEGRASGLACLVMLARFHGVAADAGRLPVIAANWQ